MNHIQGKYNIKAVSTIVGITTHTLRAWERRYGIIEPQRTESGHRLYTEEDVATLRWLKEHVEKGLHISKAVSLLKDGRMHHSFLPPEPTLRSAHVTHTERPLITRKRHELIGALLAFNESEAHHVLDLCLSMWDVESVLHNIIIPVFIEIGDRWGRGEISVAHEHYASQLLTQRIHQFFRHTRVNPAMPRIITMAGPGEQHSIGIAMFSLFLRHRGLDVYFLGANMPGEGLHAILTTIQPHAICISITLEENLTHLLKHVHELRKAYPALVIGIGGQATQLPAFPENLAPYAIGTTQSDWENWLSNLLDAFYHS
ncbi:MerR family transcriptional regulator [Aneurinibacillus uraniidurans]|uniref:MerR family transcriptional regulator n=1 Tax=Aneurinibacillus uraniidurans TaxID=2966586 RepID=UPI00234B9E8B|nr:MerR family transcriptional regulator [Aneurinibacillus sp. B1]WCN37103.1 MerR family transcriptional regulator [Aneurinibacillus sp. B1]